MNGGGEEGGEVSLDDAAGRRCCRGSEGGCEMAGWMKNGRNGAIGSGNVKLDA